MKELRRRDVPDGKYTLAFVGYGDEASAAEIELTYNYGVEQYEHGSAFGHLAIGVPDVAAACEKMRAGGRKITREPGPVEIRHDNDRLHRGPGRLQDRADPARLNEGVRLARADRAVRAVAGCASASPAWRERARPRF